MGRSAGWRERKARRGQAGGGGLGARGWGRKHRPAENRVRVDGGMSQKNCSSAAYCLPVRCRRVKRWPSRRGVILDERRPER